VVSFLSPFFFSRLPQCLHDNLFAFDARTYKNGERISSSFSALSWLKLLSFFFSSIWDQRVSAKFALWLQRRGSRSSLAGLRHLTVSLSQSKDVVGLFTIFPSF